MRSVKKVLAADVGLIVGHYLGLEKHGLFYRMKHESQATSGGQCSNCNTIVWANGRHVPIFNRERPADVPECGDGYKKYYLSLRAEFLQALSPCPQCGASSSFDLDLQQHPQRSVDGTTILEIETVTEFIETLNPDELWVWWAEFSQP